MKSKTDFNEDHKAWSQYLRTYFAAMAMQGIMSTLSDKMGAIYYYNIAEDAVKQADALIAELNKEASND